MKSLLPFLLFADSQTASDSSGSGSGSGGSMESLKAIFTNPILYIVLGSLVALIILIYILRRFVRARPSATTIIVRGGRIYKVLDEKNPKAFLVPFRDSVGAIITNDEKELSSDKLYINNGPDALYQINYTLKYKVLDPKEFYPFLNNLESTLPAKLNDELRLYADEGNALILVKDYRENADKILSIINKAVEEFHIEATSFKINIIQPLGSH